MNSLCEIREGIGLCDDCGLPKWPQTYIGLGMMICADCLKNFYQSRVLNRACSKTGAATATTSYCGKRNG